MLDGAGELGTEAGAAVEGGAAGAEAGGMAMVEPMVLLWERSGQGIGQLFSSVAYSPDSKGSESSWLVSCFFLFACSAVICAVGSLQIYCNEKARRFKASPFDDSSALKGGGLRSKC